MKTSLAKLVLASGLWVGALTSPAAGGTLVVNSTADHAVGPCDASDCTLREAVTAAQSGDLITFSVAGTITLNGTALPNIATNLTVNGGGTIEISANNLSRIFVVNSGAALSLMNLTLSHALSTGGDGGAIRSLGTLTVTDCRFLSNATSASWSGSAIYSFGPLNIANTEFALNTGGGGAVKPRSSAATTTIDDCNFHDNQSVNDAGGGYGGAMQVFDGPVVTISGSTFTNNKASYGGAIYVTANATLKVQQSAFTGNTARFNNKGGAILNEGTIEVKNTTFTTNQAYLGGGIYNSGSANCDQVTLADNRCVADDASSGAGIHNASGTFTLSNSTVSGNTGADDGGGILNAGTLWVTDTTLSGNKGGYGAGLNNRGGSANLSGVTVNGNSGKSGAGLLTSGKGTLALTNVTVSGNTASQTDGGGGITAYGSTYLINVTLSGNSAPGAGGGIYGFGASWTVRNLIIAKGASGTNCNGVLPASNSLSDDGSCGFGNGDNVPNLLLGPLANNGGPTLTHRPQTGSRAIDKGTDFGVPSTDQRGVKRPQGAAMDIGAVEVLPATLANLSTRMRVETGDNALIGGFIVTGTQPKKVMIRAIGPSLGLLDQLVNPTLELHGPSGLLEANDNWVDSPNKQAIINNTIAPGNDAEAAILATLPANNAGYTAIVRGVNGTTGIGVVEAYDLDNTVNSKLANISTRGLVETGDNILIAGTIVLGELAQKVLLRAIGPSLPFIGTLGDPTLELRDQNGGIVAANDNWRSSQEQEIIQTTIPPASDFESAIVTTLPAGGASYTAIVRGAGDSTGIAVVEVYALQ